MQQHTYEYNILSKNNNNKYISPTKLIDNNINGVNGMLLKQLESEIASTAKLMETERHKNQEEINNLKNEVNKWKKLTSDLNSGINDSSLASDNINKSVEYNNTTPSKYKNNNNIGTYDLISLNTPINISDDINNVKNYYEKELKDLKA